MTNATKFQIHYFLQNDSHSMDAIVRNKCEAEFLDIAYEVIRTLEFDITLEAEAHEEGGLRDIWKFLGKNNVQITIIISVLTLIISLKPSTDGELLELQKEEIRLAIEEKKLNIKKLKKDLSDNSSQNHYVIEEIVQNFQRNHKIIVQKSNFYQKLEKYDKVNQVGYRSLDIDNKPVTEETKVFRSDFNKFIISSKKLPVEIVENAQIEIVAPVLREGDAKWKGIYVDPRPISFEMNDPAFKRDVLAKKVSFKNGDIILCILEIHRELNEVGEVIITKYVVQAVLDMIENGVKTETESGKKYRREKELKKAQISLDL